MNPTARSLTARTPATAERTSPAHRGATVAPSHQDPPAEIAGGLGRIFPSATRIKAGLTPLAAAGLAVVMVLAAVWHLSWDDPLAIVANLVLAVVLTGIAVVRRRVHPIRPHRP